MKLALFDGGRIGVVKDSEIVDVTSAVPGFDSGYAQNHWLRLCADFHELREPLERAAATGPRIPIEQANLDAAVLNPSKIVCAAANYQEHLAEMEPILTDAQRASASWFLAFDVFLKAPSSIIGPGSDIELPDLPNAIHHESELALVIGKTARNVDAAEALDHVLGYTILIDVTVRGDGDRTRRKSYDTFTPVGPWLVTADEVGDPQDLDITLDVNGESRQSVNTRTMKVPVAQMIAYASSVMTLHPGDLLTTGSPPGVGAINPGDRLDAHIEKIGSMQLGVVGPKG
ncbi:fumarylacetoacetate hydrolase family protein [Streptomyces blattellae]|uniref:fumarylacetoacetate hydrolase family protein n=1 Tax=Streptomyces blattellae TaxID=2569855 RepID=UPI0012B77BE8|nr:fumarylacetoacetate hydrolase family protein [Streptomyces blattellae]